MEIRFLGTHNSETSDFAHTCLVLDEIWLFDCGSAASRLSLIEQQNLCGIFVTHGHYDHIKDLPALGMNYFLSGCPNLPMPVMALKSTLESISSHLGDGHIYSDFFAKGIFAGHAVELGIGFSLQGYEIIPVKSWHKLTATGYYVKKGLTSFYYTGDTQSGFAQSFIDLGLSCNTLIVECTLKNEYAGSTSHLCPQELGEELKLLVAHQGFAPRVFAVHRSVKQEEDILTQLQELSEELGFPIYCPSEGQKIGL